MKFCSLQSGSSGNCQIIQSKNTTIMVDAGLSMKRTGLLMKENGFCIEECDALFITHEHSDHILGVGAIARKYKLPVFASPKTHEAGQKTIKEIGSSLQVIRGKITVGDFEVTPVKISHDAAEPFGYVLEAEGKKVSILTDVGVITREILDATSNSDFFFIEANYDPEMLVKGRYTPVQKARIRSAWGHLSNYDCAEFLTQAIGPNTKFAMLCHISAENNHPELAKLTVESVLKEVGIHTKILLSYRDRASEVLDL